MSITRREALALTLLLPAFSLPESKAAQASVAESETVSYGPIQAPGRKVTVQRDGVQSKGFRFVPPAPETAPWTPAWIGLPDTVPRNLILFRREFQLDHVPVKAIAHLTADISYRLWVDGRLAARGPADIGMDYNRTTTGKWFYDTLDLTPYLHRGANTIAVEVFTRPVIGWEVSRSPGCFACEIWGDGVSLVTTDTGWSALPSAHWQLLDGQWHYDPYQEPAGWRSVGYDSKQWFGDLHVPDQWQPLVRSEIPARMEALYPIQTLKRATHGVVLSGAKFPVTLDADGGFTVRYDRVLPAFIGITLRGGRGGTLHIEPNEPDEPGYHRSATIALTGALQTVELPFLDSFSVIGLRVTGLQEPLEIREVRAVFASQPVAYRGSFACSDPGLTRLWEVCRWATQICHQTHHLDSPHHQEPICDPGDYMILALNNYAAFHQPALALQDLRKYAWIMEQCKNHVFHTSYSLLWLQMLLDYYDHTGDEALVRELAPGVFSLLATFTGYRGKNGLISDAPNYMFMDWVEIAGFQAHHPPAVIGQGYMTAFYYRALADGQRIAQLLGDTDRAQTYAQLRADIAAAFQRELWSESKGLYRDGKPHQSSVAPNDWLPADTDIETFSAHVNVLAVLYDLAPKDKQSAILERAIAGPDFSCQPYFMHFVFDALAHAGLFERHAVAQMRRWKIVEETQSLREMWSTGDLSHGWGATPLRQLSTHVLGVRPLAPGSTRIEIAPLPCGLTWAKGVVPTAQGDVRVEWQQKRGTLHLTADIPHGCTAKVRLPGLEKTLSAGRHHLTAAHSTA